jgi:hypothetical protein
MSENYEDCAYNLYLLDEVVNSLKECDPKSDLTFKYSTIFNSFYELYKSQLQQ